MTLSYICKWCGETFEDVVKADQHLSECAERPLNEVREET